MRPVPELISEADYFVSQRSQAGSEETTAGADFNTSSSGDNIRA